MSLMVVTRSSEMFCADEVIDEESCATRNISPQADTARTFIKCWFLTWGSYILWGSFGWLDPYHANRGKLYHFCIHLIPTTKIKKICYCSLDPHLTFCKVPLALVDADVLPPNLDDASD